MERRLLRSMRFERYYDTGAQALESLGAALAGDVPDLDTPKVVFVSLDFEYNAGDLKEGVNEFGFAKIDSEQLLCHDETKIAAFDFTLRRMGNGKRKFMFGSSTRLSLELRERTIIDFLTELSREDPQSEIILVSHNIGSEVRVLDDIGIPLETLPIAGMLDTCHLATDIFGFKGNLKSLLINLKIPFRPNPLHCAGNDAYHTLQALLALVQARYGDQQLERFTRQQVPQICCREKADEDWAENLEPF